MSIAFIIIIILVMAVVFVNGWTDAPNAIATAVSTRVMRPRAAIIMAVILNFLGALVMTSVNAQVAETISKMVVFDSVNTSEPLIALAAALFAIVAWATAAWYFGIPTSESHALIAGITGAAMAFGGLAGVNMDEWKKVIFGLLISTVMGFILGYLLVKLIEIIFKKVQRTLCNRIFGKGQIVAAGAMAFLHGAQDGQKFMGVFMLALFLNGAVSKTASGSFIIPFWVIALCSIVMGIGTSVGGWRIIKSVGMDMVKLQKHQGFAADVAAAICLLFSTLFGLPVSTTHTKTTAIVGVGAAKRVTSVDWKIVKDMVLAWVLTFPGCGIIGYAMAKLFLLIF